MKPLIPKKGFTLLEVLISIIILAALVALALPNYHKTVEQSYKRNAIEQLRTLHAANELYKLNNSGASAPGGYWPRNKTESDIEKINETLGTNITHQGMDYSCSGNFAGTTYTCSATRQSPATTFVVQVTEQPLSDTNPNCITKYCP